MSAQLSYLAMRVANSTACCGTGAQDGLPGMMEFTARRVAFAGMQCTHKGDATHNSTFQQLLSAAGQQHGAAACSRATFETPEACTGKSLGVRHPMHGW